MPAVDPVNAEEWDYLDIDVLKPARSSKVCMTCQHFHYEVGRHCVTLLTCPIHQRLIPQGDHLTRRCSRWVPRREVAVGWCSEAGGTSGTASTYSLCSCTQIRSKDCLNWSMLGVWAVRCRFSALPNFKTLKARATAKTAQGTRIQRGWGISECGCLDGHFGTMGFLGDLEGARGDLGDL